MLLSDRLEGRSVCICAGSGGVGKTTTAAAIGLGLARRGRRVAVVTIDPARRLAGALGLEELGNEPVRVEGDLWALMLDPKRTLDDLIAALATDERSARDVLDNRIYRELSGAVSALGEFSAIAKLYELHHDERFEVIVLDTPPSRNALDFLDAPERLMQFFDGRALRLLLAPTGLAARVIGRPGAALLSALSRLAGVDLVGEISSFLGALGTLVDGLRERAEAVSALLRDPETSFMVVSSPEREPCEEALYFGARLAEAGMPFGGVVVNRVHQLGLDGHEPDAVAAALADELGARLARAVAASAADFDVLTRRDQASIDRLGRELGDPDPIVVPHLDHDIADLAGLAEVEAWLFAARSSERPTPRRRRAAIPGARAR